MKTHRYTPEEIQFIKENIDRHTNTELVQLLKERFGIDLSLSSLGYALHSRGIKRSGIHVYTPEEDEFLRSILPGRRVTEVVELFNAHFGLNVSFSSIKAAIKNRKLSSGVDCRFKQGTVSHRPPKGVHYSARTEFKKGNRPVNWKPVGSERIDTEGYVYVKTQEPRTWRMKHVLNWEAVHGPVPKNHALIFRDGNRQNTDISNLILVSRGQLAVLNKQHLLQAARNANTVDSALLTVDLIRKITQLKKKRA